MDRRDLSASLGPVGMSRFFEQFELGRGDYTKERDQWLGDIQVETAIKELKKFERGE